MNNISLTQADPSADLGGESSRNLLMLVWVVSLTVSFFILVPNSDDIFYFGPALGLATKGVLAVPMDNTNVYLFSIFGTYSFFQGIFLFVTNLLGLPVHFFTYRLFQSLVVMGSLVFALRTFWLARPADVRGNANRQALFLGLLAFTPFSMALLPVRPEFLGCLFLFGALSAFGRYVRKETGWGSLLLTGILLGLSAVSHPVFALPSAAWSIVAAYQLWQRKSRSLAAPLFLLFSALLPLFAMAAFYGLHYPESLVEIQGHGRELTQQTAESNALWTGLLERVRRIFLLVPPWQ
ncbi:MAG: hypothetical protein HQL62_07850, partial [Magnetococcales bacterium]|nr:hypothetical protein [Magnetococcales bacterium]